MHTDPLRVSPLPPRVIVPAAAIGMTWTGLRTGNGTLALCGLMLGALALIAVFVSHRMRRGLVAARRHQARVFEENTAHVELRVENRGPFPILGFELRDSFPPAETHRVRLMDRRLLWPRRGRGLRYHRVCVRHRGVYPIGPLHACAADPAGLFPFDKELPVISELLVYPQTVGIQLFPLLGEGTLTRIGEEILPEPGESVEFRGVREWRPGDGRRLVHWPSTARLRRPMSKEFEQDVVTEVTIALDLRRVMQAGLGGHSTLETGVKAAASIARLAVERQHLVQLWGLGAKRRVHLPFGAGPQHLNGILDRLTLVRADGVGDLHASLLEMLPTLRRGATLVLILSAGVVDWDELEPTLRRLSFDGVRLAIVLLDDRSYLALYQEQEMLRRVAPGLADLVARLHGLGASVHTAADREDLRQRLEMPA